MLNWTFIFLIFTLVAAFFGFGGIASATAGVAKIFFTLFIILFSISLVTTIIQKGDSSIAKK